MKLRIQYIILLLSILQFAIPNSYAQEASQKEIASLNTADMNLTEARVRYMDGLDLLVFEMQAEGIAGNTTPDPTGQMNGAPVLGYVFPTTLSPQR